jgi:hypothetical protein
MATATISDRGPKCLRSFRLRTLLVLLSVVCLACGWEANRLHRRARAVELLNHWQQWVSKEGVNVNDEPWCSLPEWAYGRLSPWLSNCVGIDSSPIVCGAGQFFPPEPGSEPRAKTRSEDHPEPTRAERKQLVAAIATLTELRFVQVSFELDDEDLATLSRLAGLETLGFTTERLTGAGIAQIQKLRKLNTLDLNFDSPVQVPVGTILSLRTHPTLQRLLINGPLRPEDLERVKAALPHVAVDACSAAP